MTTPLPFITGAYGLLIVSANVFTNQIGLPVPVLPTLIVAGSMAAAGQLPLLPLFAWAVLATLAADCIWFKIGMRYGIRVLRTLCRISLEPDSCVSQTQTRFETWGINSLVIAKFVPGLSLIAPPLAGALRIGWPRFLLLSILSASLWVGVALSAGVLFHAQIGRVLKRLDEFGSTAAAVLAACLVSYIVYKWWERRRFFNALRMARISVSELYELIDAGAAPTIVDVRSSTARALDPRWIPGALHVPLDAVARHLEDLPRDRDIILYCACPSEASAARVARVLMSHGFKKVRPLYGGLDAWVAAGHSVGSVEEQVETSRESVAA